MPMDRMIDPGQHLQRLNRAGRTYTDQHGRKFFAQADMVNQQPIEELRPVGFTVPWLPPMRYAKWNAIGDLQFRWDYQQMADELATNVASYYEEATKFAIEHNFPIPEVGGVVDRRIAAVHGPAPLSPEIPLAAEAGDPWLLGVPGAPRNDDLAPLLRQGVVSTGGDALTAIKDRIAKRLQVVSDASASDVVDPATDPTDDAPVTYKQFVAEGRKNGLSMPDITLAWQAHKQNLAAEAVAA